MTFKNILKYIAIFLIAAGVGVVLKVTTVRRTPASESGKTAKTEESSIDFEFQEKLGSLY